MCGYLWKKWWKHKKSENQSLFIILRITDALGLWPEGRGPLLIFFYSFGAIYSVTFILNEFLFVIFKFSFDAVIILIQYSAFLLSPAKLFTFLIDQKKWCKLMTLISVIEQESLSDNTAKHVPIVLRFKTYCGLIVKVFCSNYVILDIMFASFFFLYNVALVDLTMDEEIMVNYNIYNVLLPFDTMTRSGRIISGCLQMLFLQVSAAHVLCWDSMVLAVMLFLSGQLKALRVRCVHALDQPGEDVCVRNLLQCHTHYLRILQCHKMFNSLISPITFMYYVMIQVNYGVSIVLLVSNQSNTTQLYTAVIMIFALGFQLLIHFSLGNELIIASEDLSYGIFESNWVDTSARVRRLMLMVSLGMGQRVALKAGPFREMSLATFVAILRTSYSFYTLLRKSH